MCVCVLPRISGCRWSDLFIGVHAPRSWHDSEHVLNRKVVWISLKCCTWICDTLLYLNGYDSGATMNLNIIYCLHYLCGLFCDCIFVQKLNEFTCLLRRNARKFRRNPLRRKGNILFVCWWQPATSDKAYRLGWVNRVALWLFQIR